jgi:hypothetical protein
VNVRLGVSVSAPFVWRCLSGRGRDPCFHIPLIEPDWRVWRIRLPDKLSCLRPRQVTRQPRQPNQSQGLVEVLVGEAIAPLALDPMLSA